MRSPIRLLGMVVLLASLAGCSGSRPDAAITTDIQSKLFASPEAKTSSVDVSTRSGEVTLSGTVTSDAAHYEAYKIATQTPGVTKVNDQLTVASAQAEPQPAPAAVPLAPAPKPSRTQAQPSRPQKRETASAGNSQPTASELPSPAPAPVANNEPPSPPPFVQPTPPPAPPAPVMRTVEIPAGTPLHVQTVDSINSAVNKTGESFRASLSAPIVVNNEVVVPSGADVNLRLVDASSAGRFKGRSGLTVALDTLEFQGKTYELSSSDYTQTGASEGKRTAATIGGGAAIGAIIGGIVGGGKGAAIGAGAGAGAGTVGSAATKAQQVQIPAEAKLDFTLQQGVNVTYNPERNRSTR